VLLTYVLMLRYLLTFRGNERYFFDRRTRRTNGEKQMHISPNNPLLTLNSQVDRLSGVKRWTSELPRTKIATLLKIATSSLRRN